MKTNYDNDNVENVIFTPGDLSPIEVDEYTFEDGVLNISLAYAGMTTGADVTFNVKGTATENPLDMNIRVIMNDARGSFIKASVTDDFANVKNYTNKNRIGLYHAVDIDVDVIGSFDNVTIDDPTGGLITFSLSVESIDNDRNTRIMIEAQDGDLDDLVGKTATLHLDNERTLQLSFYETAQPQAFKYVQDDMQFVTSPANANVSVDSALMAIFRGANQETVGFSSFMQWSAENMPTTPPQLIISESQLNVWGSSEAGIQQGNFFISVKCSENIPQSGTKQFLGKLRFADSSEVTVDFTYNFN